MNRLFPTSCWIHEKLWKSCQLWNLTPPLRINHDPQFKKNFVTQLFFWEKSPKHNDVASKLNARVLINGEQQNQLTLSYKHTSSSICWR